MVMIRRNISFLCFQANHVYLHDGKYNEKYGEYAYEMFEICTDSQLLQYRNTIWS